MSFEKTLSRFPTSLSATNTWRIAFTVIIALSTSCLSDFAWSAESRVGVLQLDPSKTLVEFRLGGRLHTTHGKFQLERGTIEADPGSGKAEGAIVVDASSGDSGDSMRDNRMRGSVLEAQKYREIVFTPQHVDGHLNAGGGFQGKLQGLLKLHGIDHEITIDAQGTLIDDNLVATAHFSIPYVAWGLKDPSLLFLTVAKDVDIDIATAGHLTWLPRKASSQTSAGRSPS